MPTEQKSQRGGILLENAEVLGNEPLPGAHWLMRLAAPRISERAQAGQFVHLTCDPDLPLRRPLSLLKSDPARGIVELLYKISGTGTARLTHRVAGESISLLGPIGQPFSWDKNRPRRLLLGGGVGIPPILFLADRLRARGDKPLVLMGSEVAFPFRSIPSSILLPEMPAGTIAAMPLLEDKGIPNRLASGQGFPGCFEGHVTDLARHWLERVNAETRDDIQLFACGPEPMLRATARLAADFHLPAQIALEEHMACGTGGCAGCVVPIHRNGERRMLRVCVDGPVFDADCVYPLPPA